MLAPIQKPGWNVYASTTSPMPTRQRHSGGDSASARKRVSQSVSLGTLPSEQLARRRRFNSNSQPTMTGELSLGDEPHEQKSSLLCLFSRSPKEQSTKKLLERHISRSRTKNHSSSQMDDNKENLPAEPHGGALKNDAAAIAKDLGFSNPAFEEISNFDAANGHHYRLPDVRSLPRTYTRFRTRGHSEPGRRLAPIQEEHDLELQEATSGSEESIDQMKAVENHFELNRQRSFSDTAMHRGFRASFLASLRRRGLGRLWRRIRRHSEGNTSAEQHKS